MLALILACFVTTASASDVGTPVLRRGRPLFDAVKSAPAIRGLSAQTHDSDWIAHPFDTILFQGVTSDPVPSFQGARQEKGGAWSVWYPAVVYLHQGGRFWARVRFPDAKPGRVRLRLSNSLKPLSVFSVEAFDSAVVEPPPPTPPSAQSVEPIEAPVEGLIGRDAWGANESREPFSAHTPVRLTQHHTAGRYTTALEDSQAEVRFIQHYHQVGRGWNDVGYHFLVDAEGRVFEGRPANVIGAHVRNNNTNNVGVSLLGNYHPPFDHALTAKQREAVRRIGLWLRERYGVSADLYAGHRDFSRSTECPGNVVYPLLGELRDSMRPYPAGLAERWERVKGSGVPAVLRALPPVQVQP